MAREYMRSSRVGEQIQRELAEMLTREIDDPRLHGVTLSGVDLSPDLSNAKVYVTLPSGADVKGTLAALNRASGFLRRGLSKRTRLRAVPRLGFVYDPTLDRAGRISALLDSARPACARDDDSEPEQEDR